MLRKISIEEEIIQFFSKEMAFSAMCKNAVNPKNWCDLKQAETSSCKEKGKSSELESNVGVFLQKRENVSRDKTNLFSQKNEDHSNSDVVKCGNYYFNDAEDVFERFTQLFTRMISSSAYNETPSVSPSPKYFPQPNTYHQTNNNVGTNGEKTLNYIFSFEGENNKSNTLNGDLKAPQEPTVCCPMFPLGMVLPIDDDEFAVLKKVEPDQEISYDIYSKEAYKNAVQDNLMFAINTNPVPKNSTEPGAVVTRNHFRKSFSFSKYQNDDGYTTQKRCLSVLAPTNFNLDGNCIDISTSPPDICLLNEPVSDGALPNGSCFISSSNVESLNHSDEYDKISELQISSLQKEKPSIPLFESNGLFMKRDHPIFSNVFSRKVFVGGLPRHITIEEMEKQFSTFGPVWVDWPNREEELVPPHGFAFLHFESTSGVRKLYECVNKSKNKYSVSTQYVKSKEVEIKFWKMIDSEILFISRNIINPRFTVFVGALPRICTAQELAAFMERRFTSVVYAAIDVDFVYGYPKGAGRVTFSQESAYKKALDSHYIDMTVGINGKWKKIEIKPFLLTDQKCDLCPPSKHSQVVNKYCYHCGCYVCDQCESTKLCTNNTSHCIIARTSDQSPVYTDY